MVSNGGTTVTGMAPDENKQNNRFGGMTSKNNAAMQSTMRKDAAGRACREGGRRAGQGRVLGSDAKLLAALHTVGQSVGPQSNQNGFTGMGTERCWAAWPGADGEAGDVAWEPWRRTPVRHMKLVERPRLGVRQQAGAPHRSARGDLRLLELAQELSTPMELSEAPVEGARKRLDGCRVACVFVQQRAW